MKRWASRWGFVIVAVTLSSAVAAGAASPAIETLITQTEQAILVESLRDDLLYLLAGALALGLGIGLVVASSVTYWHKQQQLQRGS